MVAEIGARMSQNVSKCGKEGEECHCHDDAPSRTTLRQRVGPYSSLIIALSIVTVFAGIAMLIEGYVELHVFMQYLMAGYFLVFGITQTISLKKSAKILQQYDTIAKHVPFYGYVYPPLQIALGFAYLLWISPIIVNVIAATVLFFTLIGVIDALESKKKIRCGCLGDTMNVSVGWVTLWENAIMFVMAFGMLVYFFGSLEPNTANTPGSSSDTHQHRSL
jgi:hypothetical protein